MLPWYFHTWGSWVNNSGGVAEGFKVKGPVSFKWYDLAGMKRSVVSSLVMYQFGILASIWG
jgi:hypothetical protein